MVTASTLRSLASIHGLDTTAGLRAVGSRQQVYLRILSRFVETYSLSPPPLNDGMPREDLSAAAHSLRGACGSIGALALASSALALEQACNTGASLEQLIGISAEVQQSLSALLSQLHEHLKPPGA